MKFTEKSNHQIYKISGGRRKGLKIEKDKVSFSYNWLGEKGLTQIFSTNIIPRKI